MQCPRLALLVPLPCRESSPPTSSPEISPPETRPRHGCRSFRPACPPRPPLPRGCCQNWWVDDLSVVKVDHSQVLLASVTFSAPMPLLRLRVASPRSVLLLKPAYFRCPQSPHISGQASPPRSMGPRSPSTSAGCPCSPPPAPSRPPSAPPRSRRCSRWSPVYFSRGAKAVVKYEPRALAVSVAASTLDLGKHEVNLTRLLPLSFEDLEDDGDSGFEKWSTSFRLSGPVRGARLNVTFSCSLLAGGGTSEQHRGGEVAGLRRGSMARAVSVQVPTPLPARSRGVRVLHEVLPSLRSARPVPSSVADGGPDARKEEVAAPDCTEEGSPEAKHCTSVEPSCVLTERLERERGCAPLHSTPLASSVLASCSCRGALSP
ncbi:uncharacterized protein [Zea mays]|uniref:Protein PLASTID MOVEMENT IMPAIRED 1-RELATED 1 n=1 Tax=Zea mays TaxID=4577 RepID=A0A804UBH1_MAIZE|nr:uncharacterized protein LOC103630211 [Zea mays]|eukprot:XP_008649510.1 uncharacterized protein LOC103630211 [Zea mays]